jgi:4-hydroxy-tetrahydrodipicolinate synthase
MFRGSMVALVTPFREGRIDWPAMDRLVDMHVKAGTDALVPCGTTGESPTLTRDEHDEMVARVVERAAGRMPVIAGTGTNDTAETVRRTEHARSAGAAGALIVTPYYNKPTQEGLFRHYAQVAERVDLPIVLYNVPSRTGVELSVATIARLREQYKNIVAVKHATGSVDTASELSLASDIAIISGDDSLTLPLMSIGAVGVISVIANLVPEQVKRMTDAAIAGDWPTALELHRKLYPLGKGMLSLATNPIPIKTAMALRNLIAEEFRLPLCPVDAEPRAKLRALLADMG